MSKSGRQCILQIPKDACTYFDLQFFLQCKYRDKCYLIMILKSLFEFFETTDKVSKHYHWQKTLMLCHWWHQDSIVTIPCLRTVSMVYQQKRDREVDWFEVRVTDRNITGKQTERKEWGEEVGMEVYRSDICDQVIRLEAIPLPLGRKGVATWFWSCIAQGIQNWLGGEVLQ